MVESKWVCDCCLTLVSWDNFSVISWPEPIIRDLSTLY